MPDPGGNGGEVADHFDVMVGPLADLGPDHRLVLASVMRLQPVETSAQQIDLVGSRTTIGPLVAEPAAAGSPGASAGIAGYDGSTWTFAVRCEFRARHANDGIVAAYLVEPDGTTIDITVTAPLPDPTSASDAGPTASSGLDAVPPRPDSTPEPPTVLPRPQIVRVGERRVSLSGGLRCTADPQSAEGRAWRSVADLARRVGVTLDAGDDAPEVSFRTVDGFGDEGYLIRPASTVEIHASTSAGHRHALVTLGQLVAGDRPLAGEIEDHPAWPVRVAHLDVARRWFEPDVVLRLIDLAAWRKFSHVHLHLTDDEAWRVPVPSMPELAERGGTRGHGLPVGALCGSGAAPYGRAYTADEIGEWVARADDLGIELVPEIDVPGHCHAALAAVPTLVDPAAGPGVASIQGFVGNVLVPGRAETDRFVDDVFGALADLFPSSLTLHVGGDEVPTDAWAASPAAQRFAAAAGATDHRSLHGAFVRSIADRVRAASARRVASWEEAAFSGGVAPDDGYVVAWTGVDAAHRLLDAGFDVVASPAQAYYLDMAIDREWTQPGASWAGHTDLATTCAFDPSTLASESDGTLVGVQACLWAEHLDSIETLDHLAFPRLDAIADTAWFGASPTDTDPAGRAARIAATSARLPRFAH